MPEAVLQGPDGQPAIDAQTGMPLTMEELLRRRGILAVNGTSSLLNQSASGQAAPATAQAAPTAASALQAARGGKGATPVSAVAAPVAVDPAVAVASDVVDPATAPAAVTDLDTERLLSAIGGGAGAYAGYKVSNALLNRKKKAGVNSPQFGANTGPAPKPGQTGNGAVAKSAIRTMNKSTKRLPAPAIIDGEYSVVNALTNARKALTGPAGRALTRIK